MRLGCVVFQVVIQQLLDKVVKTVKLADFYFSNFGTNGLILTH